MTRAAAHLLRSAILLFATVALCLAFVRDAAALPLSNGTFNVQTGPNGELSSLQLVGDAFPTNYVLNASNAPGQDTADHEWVGELMFSYRTGNGAWQTALSQSSADGRTITSTGTSVTVTYQSSANAQGIKNFKVVETYSLVDDYLYWQIQITNTSAQAIEFGDVGLPLPFNEYWFGNDVIYETRTVYHSFIGNDSSYVTVKRPSGVGEEGAPTATRTLRATRPSRYARSRRALRSTTIRVLVVRDGHSTRVGTQPTCAPIRA